MTQAPREWTFPASGAQERVWIANQLDLESPVYNVPAFWKSPVGLTSAQITEMINQVVARHEALRTHLRTADGALVQVVQAAEPFELPITDVGDLTGQQRLDRVNGIGAELARQPIPLDQAPLWRGRLLRYADTEWVLAFVVHHAVFDSRSLMILTES